MNSRTSSFVRISSLTSSRRKACTSKWLTVPSSVMFGPSNDIPRSVIIMQNNMKRGHIDCMLDSSLSRSASSVRQNILYTDKPTASACSWRQPERSPTCAAMGAGGERQPVGIGQARVPVEVRSRPRTAAADGSARSAYGTYPNVDARNAFLECSERRPGGGVPASCRPVRRAGGGGGRVSASKDSTPCA